MPLAYDGCPSSVACRARCTTPQTTVQFRLRHRVVQRLLQAQGQPRHLLHQWLTEPVIAMQIDAPLEEQLRQTMEELGQLQRSQAAMKSLMDQVNDQQRRTRRLLATRLFQAQEPDAAG